MCRNMDSSRNGLGGIALPPSEKLRFLAIIPAFLEEASISRVVSATREQGLDVLVVDDHSPDKTSEEALKAGAMLIRLPFHLGYAGTLQTGYIFALANGYDAIIQLDGDGQHDPQDAQKLLEPILNGEADLVMGSRFMGEITYEIPWPRRMGQKFFGFLASFITGHYVSDPTTGYRALSAKVIRLYCSLLFPDDFPDANMWILLHRIGFKVLEKPVKMHASQGLSMHRGIVRPLYYIFRMILAIFIATFRDVPKKENL